MNRSATPSHQWTRRRAGAAAAIFLAFAVGTRAEDWPTRPVTMVVPYAAGGPVDVLGRIMAQRLGEILGQPVLIENVTGAGGMTGTNRVARAANDGYQFVLGGVGTIAFIPSLFKKPLYNPVADFEPVGLITEQPLVLLARKDLPANNLQEFIAYARAHQAKIQFGSGGAGSGNHLACVLLNAAIGVDITHIPHRGAVYAASDLMAGRLDYMCDSMSTALPQIEGDTVKALAVLTRDRSSRLPNLATAHEQGLTDFSVSIWNALFLPKGAPEAIVRRLHDAANEAVDTPQLRARLDSLGVSVVPPERRSTAYLAPFVASEIAKWAGPIKASGATIE